MTMTTRWGTLDAYMYLVWGERAMELSMGSVDHFDQISLADTSILLEIDLDILLLGIVG